jgi:hypothetical protein
VELSAYYKTRFSDWRGLSIYLDSQVKEKFEEP